MPNLISLTIVYDSSGLLTGLNTIDLICSNQSKSKQISSAVYNVSVNPPLKVFNPVDASTKVLTKIEDCDGSYYLVSDPYGKISDALTSNCEFCNTIQGGSQGMTGTGVNGQIAFFNGTSTLAGDTNLIWDNTNKRLAVGVTNPTASIDTSTLRVRNLPNTQGDPAYNKQLVINQNGTVGYKEMQNSAIVLSYVPLVNILSFDAADPIYFIMKMMVTGVVGPIISPYFDIWIHTGVANDLKAQNVETFGQTLDASATLPGDMVSTTSFVINVRFPKANNTSPLWTNTSSPNIMITAVFKGAHNSDVSSGTVYTVPRVGIATKIKNL